MDEVVQKCFDLQFLLFALHQITLYRSQSLGDKTELFV